MNHPVSTPAQVRAVLPALRKHRGLTQAQLGALIGVSQKRIARIEADPAKASFDQISKLVVLLGGDLVVVGKAPVVASKPAPKAKSKLGDNW
jgi:HTH-type transcriptional regulator / antitoxin HipB